MMNCKSRRPTNGKASLDKPTRYDVILRAGKNKGEVEQTWHTYSKEIAVTFAEAKRKEFPKRTVDQVDIP